MDVTCGAGTTDPSRVHEFIPAFSGVRDTQSLVLCVVFCRSLLVLFPFAIVLFVLIPFMDADYPFSIFKLLSGFANTNNS
jgi:hypothetical protein